MKLKDWLDFHHISIYRLAKELNIPISTMRWNIKHGFKNYLLMEKVIKYTHRRVTLEDLIHRENYVPRENARPID